MIGRRTKDALAAAKARRSDTGRLLQAKADVRAEAPRPSAMGLSREADKVGTTAALNLCRESARKLQSGLANKSSEQMPFQSLVDFRASLERAVLRTRVQAAQASDPEGGC
jgi:hypothetical protein